MRRARSSILYLSLLCVACGDKADEAAPPSAPIVGVLELPVSLRSSATAPADAAEVEISPSALNVAGQPVLTLAGGTVAAADRQGDVIPKLTAALQSPARARIALAVSAQVPYETVVLVLSTAKKVGMRGVAFKVRPPGGSTSTGYLTLDDYEVHPALKLDQDAALQGVAVRPWSDFTSRWEEVEGGCRAAPTGSCAYKPGKIAEGGNLKIVLHASGQGVNVNFVQVGAPPPAADKPAAPKVKMIEGIKQTDIVADVEEAPPATEASFQFRATEVLGATSAVSATLKPVCGTTACGAFVMADKITLFVRVASLLGAAFPEGTPAPIVGFQLP
jgi:biopolymer transport protein ExbD